MGNYSIAVIPGDGIGPEVTNRTCEVLEEIGKLYGHSFSFQELLAGGSAIDATGEPLPEYTLAACKKSDAVLLGAVGGPKWDTVPGDKRPERALLGLREGLGLYANLRPAVLLPSLSSACPIKDSYVKDGIDIMIVRELTGGIYFGDRGRSSEKGDKEYAYDTEKYSVYEIERIARIGFEMAQKRKKKVTCVDKANVLESSRLWREVVDRVAKDYKDVELTYMYVDNASMQMVRNPGFFDVIISTNMFGDILSDEAGEVTGSIGMLPSASLGAPGTPGMYEPVHGSAPDIAGQDKANPLATILSAAMLLRWSFQLHKEADAIEKAVTTVLEKGFRTADIAESSDTPIIGTREMTQRVIEALL